MSPEGALFEKSVQKVEKILKVTGLNVLDKSLDGLADGVVKRIRSRLFFCFLFLWVNTDLLAEVAWFIDGVHSGRTITELTYVAPCITHTLLGNIKAICFLSNEALIHDLVNTLRRLQNVKMYNKDNGKFGKQCVKHVSFLNTAASMQIWLNIMAIVGFGILPFLVMIISYYYSHQIQLALPFLVLYPFDVYDLKYYPFVYAHEIISGLITVFFVFAADYMYYFCCTFIQIQFMSLQYDISRIIPKDTFGCKSNDEYMINLKLSVCKHKELIRCVYLMEHIYSKSTLFNFVVSSFLICLTGFNVTAIEVWPKVLPFIAFLILVIVQIYLFCYFGDKVKESSFLVKDGVYISQWYNADTSVRKDMLIILIRAQKPCILTAWGFSEISLRTLRKILSTATSYFALLSTVSTVK